MAPSPLLGKHLLLLLPVVNLLLLLRHIYNYPQLMGTSEAAGVKARQQRFLPLNTISFNPFLSHIQHGMKWMIQH